MKAFKQYIHEETVRKGVEYHVENSIPLAECVFRPHSEGFYRFFQEARKQYREGLLEVTDPFDIELLETDLGDHDEYEGELVPLDIPLVEAEYDGRDVELNKPQRGGSKKFFVYVKDGDKVKRVEWGDTTGLKMKISDPEARKSFAARHQCHLKKDKTKPGYWACRVPQYGKQLGLSKDSTGNFFW